MVTNSYKPYQTTNTVVSPEHNSESDVNSVMTWIQGHWTACRMPAYTMVEKSVVSKYQSWQEIPWILPSLGLKGLIPQSLVSPGTADPRNCESIQEKIHSCSTLSFLRQLLGARLQRDTRLVHQVWLLCSSAFPQTRNWGCSHNHKKPQWCRWIDAVEQLHVHVSSYHDSVLSWSWKQL